MRVLVMSHASVIAVNQQMYVDLDAMPDTDVALIMPERWKSEYDGSVIIPKLLPETTFPVFRLPIAKPGSIPMYFYKRLPVPEFKAWKPDVILAWQEPFSLSGYQAFRLAQRLGVPFVLEANQNLFKRYPPPFSWIERQILGRADGLITCSEEVRQVMIRKGRKGPSVVMPYATDVRLFLSRDANPVVADRVAALRKNLGLREDAFVIGYIGRLVPEKGLDTLLQSVALLPPALRQRVQVLFVGSGAAEQSLRDEANALGISDKLVFAGTVAHAEVPDYMAALELFVLPSRTTPAWKEQFGRVVIEALACGVPVAGSDSGEIPNLIRATDGGIVFPEGDARILADGIADLLQNPEKRIMLGRIGKEAVYKGFTMEAVARQLHDILQQSIEAAHSK